MALQQCVQSVVVDVGELRTHERERFRGELAHFRDVDAGARDIGIVVEDLTATIEFFLELGLELEGRAMIEGEWAGRVTGLGDQRVEIAMMRTPDGHSRLELSRFLMPPVVADHRTGAWVDAATAIFTKTPLSTPMSSGLIAHADQASRDADEDARDGVLVPAASVLQPPKVNP